MYYNVSKKHDVQMENDMIWFGQAKEGLDCGIKICELVHMEI